MSGLSVGAAMVWKIAAAEAAAATHRYIETEHLFIGTCSLEKVRRLLESPTPQLEMALLAEREALQDVLRAFELDPTALRRRVRGLLGRGNHEREDNVVHRSAACKEVFDLASGLAAPLGEVSCLHLLAAMLEEPGALLDKVLAEEGVNAAALRERALAVAASRQGAGGEPVQVHPGQHQMAEADTHYLDRYGRDLTREAQEGRLGPFIGRRKELLQVIQTLARRTKNNPVLVGEAGVGKTAIVEALTVRAVQGKDPHVLAGARIVELNIGSLVAGTKYRGEFEERLTRVIEEVRKHPEVILFIDEIHNVVGAGRAEGSMDASNILKPALSRGDLRCIGATTIAEYRRYVETDAALERRFEKVVVDEPTRDEALDILTGIRTKLREHHHVRIDDRALEAAVDLSIRFDTDHQLPDKAIDLIDKAGARARVPILSMRADVTGPGDEDGGTLVTELTVAQVLSEKIGVPLDVVTGHLEGVEQARLLELEAFLKGRIVGQDEALGRVCQRLLMAHAGLGGRRGPLAVFLFLGPTGVGKTELARSLASFLFGSEADLIRLDMSEFMEEHSVAKLIGSPPGYVGHEEEGQLTGRLRTKPYSVVLLDEVEKAHPRVFDLFLQIFDEGRLTDSKGRTADARNAIFVMTSNIPAERRVGFERSGAAEPNMAVLREVRKRFRAEFINRIDEQIVFRPLGETEVRRILRSMLDELCEDLQRQHKVSLRIGEEAEAAIAHAGYSSAYGARELSRALERLVKSPLSKLMLGGELKQHTRWEVVPGDEGLSIIPVSGETL